MQYEAKTITLRDGSAALFRSPKPEDAAAFLDFYANAAAETNFLLATAAEAQQMTVDAERQWIENALNDPDRLMIACELDGLIAGNCSIAFNAQAKTRHRASLAIALRQRYWGRGIGTAMMRELIAAARQQGVTQLELDYIEGNDRGRALYEKMGFRPWGELPCGIRQSDGTMRRLIYMVLPLD